MSEEIWEEIRNRGYKVRYIPHAKIKEYNACYRVVYNGKEIYPPAALKLEIPTGEIWISDAFKDFTDCILLHEFREIQHRAEGHNVDEAHLLALKDEVEKCKNDKNWEKLKREINVCSCESLIEIKGIGVTLAKRIIDNRPYDSIDELLQIKGIGKKKYEKLRKNFWCV